MAQYFGRGRDGEPQLLLPNIESIEYVYSMHVMHQKKKKQETERKRDIGKTGREYRE